MIYERCKCGKQTAFGSYGSPPCAMCEECGSTLASSPDTHAEPEPHTLKTHYRHDTGKAFQFCTRGMCTYRVGYEEAGVLSPPDGPVGEELEDLARRAPEYKAPVE